MVCTVRACSVEETQHLSRRSTVLVVLALLAYETLMRSLTMVISVDGQVRTTVTPSSTTFADFSAGTLTPGTHTVRIAFTNDARTSSEDRNLWLDLARS